MLQDLLGDIRYTGRTLARQPGFTLLAIATLALGIGASVSVFSVVKQVLLEPLPYPDADRLVVIWERNLSRGFGQMATAPANYVDWREQNTVFEEVASFDEGRYLLGLGQETEQVHGARVTASLFPTIGADPFLGRPLTSENEGPEGVPAAVISYRLWNRLGASRDLEDVTVHLNDREYPVVGVMPPGFIFPPPISFEGQPQNVQTDVWIPFRMQFKDNARGAHFMSTVARLRPGIEISEAEANLNTIAARLQDAYPNTNTGWDVTVRPFREEIVGQSAARLWVLFGAVLMVLLVGCVNVANLLLARGASRRREFAVRTAVGASTGRLVRQLLVESLCLSLVGGVLGLLLASWSTAALLQLAPSTVFRLDQATIDAGTAAFAVGLSLLTGVLFGLTPALEGLRFDVATHLREGGRDAAQSRPSGRLQSALVVAEVALSVTLLVGAALLFQSLMNLITTDSGIEIDNVVTASVRLPASSYESEADLVNGFQRLEDRLTALSEVEAAGFILDLPLAESRQGTSFNWEGRPPFPPEQETILQFTFVTPGYFPATGLQALEGRLLTQSDVESSDPVLVVNEEFVRRYGEGRPVVGQRISAGFNTQTNRRIVGVVPDVRNESLREEAVATAYVPYSQFPFGRALSLVARSRVPTETLLARLNAEMREFDRSIALYNPQTMAGVVRNALQNERFSALLLGLFSGLALLLACIGVYGVMSYSVVMRTQETGVRMALGAGRLRILREIWSGGIRLAVLGIALGLGSSLVFGRLMASQLYGVEPHDATTLVAVPVIMLATVTLASLIPAWRATRTYPAIALRAG